MSLLSYREIELIFQSSYFYQNQLIYVVDPKTRTYQTDINYQNFIEYADHIRQSFHLGCTIILKGLEGFHPLVAQKALSYGPNVDAHLYLTKSAGSISFDFHEDDRDVYIHMIKGTKVFEIKNQNRNQNQGLIEKQILKEGQELYIPKGVLHRAQSLGMSIMISFGREALHYFALPGGLQVSDFVPDRSQLEI
ncbi:MAG: JmjC domain-containing protein [Bdellovibrionales bacterium]